MTDQKCTLCGKVLNLNNGYILNYHSGRLKKDGTPYKTYKFAQHCKSCNVEICFKKRNKKLNSIDLFEKIELLTKHLNWLNEIRFNR